MAHLNWTAVGALGSVGAVALGFLTLFRKHVWRALLFAKRALDYLNPIARIENQMRLQTAWMEQRFGDLDAQFKPNGGNSLRDVLDEVQSELRLHAARTMMLLDRSPLLMWQSAPDGRQLWANETLVALTGRSAAELLGWGWMNVVHEDDQDDMRRRWKRALEEQRIFEHSCRMVGRDGMVWDTHLMAKPDIFNGKVSSWVGVATVTATSQKAPPESPSRAPH